MVIETDYYLINFCLYLLHIQHQIRTFPHAYEDRTSHAKQISPIVYLVKILSTKEHP